EQLTEYGRVPETHREVAARERGGHNDREAKRKPAELVGRMRAISGQQHSGGEERCSDCDRHDVERRPSHGLQPIIWGSQGRSIEIGFAARSDLHGHRSTFGHCRRSADMAAAAVTTTRAGWCRMFVWTGR